MTPALPYLIAASLAAAVGAVELVTRNPDAPARALRTWPAALYCLVNALSAAAALGTIDLFFPDAIDLGTPNSADADPPPEGMALGALQERVLEVLLAAVGSAAVFRSAFINLKLGGQEVPLGLGAILQRLLGTTNRGVERCMGPHRLGAVQRIMKGMTFAQIHVALALKCMSLVTASQEEQQRIGLEDKALAGSKSLSDQQKCESLGLLLLAIVGEELLEEAVKSLRPVVGAGGDGQGSAEPGTGATSPDESS